MGFIIAVGQLRMDPAEGSSGKNTQFWQGIAMSWVLLTSMEILLQALVLWLHHLMHLPLMIFPCLCHQQRSAFKTEVYSILQQLNPEAQPITEMDASNTGVEGQFPPRQG